jgi:hypothetical protein
MKVYDREMRMLANQCFDLRVIADKRTTPRALRLMQPKSCAVGWWVFA